MNEIVKVFDEQVVRIHDRDGAPWFVAKDVCNVLELDDVRRAVEALDDDEKLTGEILHSGQTRKMYLISESGLYKLVMRSRKPAAKRFVKWITSEVLPALRRNGAYVHENANVENVLKAVLEAQDRQVGPIVRQNLEMKAELRYLKLFEPLGEPGEVSEITGLPKINWQRGRWTSGRGRNYQDIVKALQGELPGLFDHPELTTSTLVLAPGQ